MSQSTTWDLLCLAADHQRWRGADSAFAMPEPEVAWKRATRRSRRPRFLPGSILAPLIRVYWDNYDWLRWRLPQQDEYRLGMQRLLSNAIVALAAKESDRG